MNPGFWQMGGFAVYVWGAYGAGALVFAWNLLVPWLHRRALSRAMLERNVPDGLPEAQP